MKKALIPAFGLLAFTVAGCSFIGKQQIDGAAFQAIINKMKKPSFTIITAKYEFKYVNHEDFNFTSDEKYEYLLGDGWFVSPSSEGTHCYKYVGFSLYGTVDYFSNYKNIKYFKTPFGVEYDVIEGNYEEHVVWQFDKTYGVVKKIKTKGFYESAPKEYLNYLYTFSYK